MDSNKAKNVLDKINVLYDNLTSNQTKISALEKDLLLSYIRELYEAVLQESEAKPEFSVQTKESAKPTFEIVSPKTERTIEEPKIIDIEEEPEPKVVFEPISQPEPAKEVAPSYLEPQPRNTDRNFEQLFEYKKATELSEKLSESPISDLTRAMSINDKLLYVNELFDRDIEAFNETLKVLNRFDSLQDARGLLSNLAERYEWLGNNKIEIARDFIKLTRRRYL